MITQDHSSNKKLFDKANELLGYTTDDKKITTIDQYFLNLDNIKAKLQVEGFDITYLMLPTNEPFFEINANTRSIAIPEAFKNGISVQGDEVAEIIFFSIDRYYDTTDFYDNHIIPVIQWKYANDTSLNAYHLSATTGKVVLIDEDSKTGGTVKVVFGWPISKEVTEQAGNIQFSVRFLTIYDDEGKLITNWTNSPISEQENLEYSFSTLNAVTKINPGLNINIHNNAFSYDNKNDLIWRRIRKSISADLNLQAINPIIEYFKPEAGTFADLDETGYLTLKVKPIYPSGTNFNRIGKQIYEIWRINSRDEESLYATGTVQIKGGIIEDGENVGFDIEFIPISEIAKNETELNSTDYYFKKVIKEDGSIDYEPYDEGTITDDLYKRVQTYKIDKAGKYYVKIINFIDDVNKGENSTETFEIALPSEPIVGQSSSDVYDGYILKYIKDEEGIDTPEVIPQTLTLSAVDKDGGIPLVYNWYRSQNENGEKVLLTETPQENIKFVVNQPGYYYLEAINQRNKEYISAFSNGIRVTYPATKPLGEHSDEQPLYLVDGYPLSQRQLNDQIISYTTTLRLTPHAERSDYFTYEWHKESNPSVVISRSDELSFTNSDIDSKVYCIIHSMYNGDKSEPLETVHFTIAMIK